MYQNDKYIQIVCDIHTNSTTGKEHENKQTNKLIYK